MEEKKLKKLMLLKEEPSLAIFDELEEIQENLEPIKESLVGIDFIKGEPGENGKDGKDGKDGYTPIKGIDYFDGKDGRDGKDGKDGYTPIKGKDYFDGKDGKDGRDGLDGLKGEKGDKPRHKWEGTKLRFENPDGKWGQAVDLKGETGRAFIGYGGGGSNVRVKNDGTLISDNPVKFLNFKGTGLDSISNDGNGQVTITVNDSQDLSGYLKLDQSTPQTTIGRFNFPNLAVDTDTIYTKDGNVGIGTTTPTYKLDVSGTGRFTQPVIVGAPTVADHAATKSYVDSTAGGGVGAGTSGQTLRHNGTSWVANSNLYNNGTNVGIGTTNPGVKLDVAGQGRFQSTTFPVVDIIRDTASKGGSVYGGAKLERLTTTPTNNGGIGFYFKYPNSAGASTFAGMFGGALSNITNGSEVGDLVFGAAWQGADPAYNKHLIIRATGTNTGDVLVPNGNVGIGLTNPSYKLDVSGGDINVSGVFRKGGTAGVSDSAAGIPTSLTVSGGIVTAVTKTTGLSVTKTIKGSDGNDCNLVFTSGLLTSTTCP